MRKSVRKFMGVAVLGVLAALFALPMAGAGAQEFIPGEGAPPAPECNITSIAPIGTVASFPVVVNVEGTTDQDGAEITLYGRRLDIADAPVVVLDSVIVSPAGPFALSGQVDGDSTLTIGIVYGPENAYAAACANEAGVEAFTVESNKVVRPGTGPAAAQLAFTGSSETPSYVLIGIAAVVVGAVLVVAARRRSHLS